MATGLRPGTSTPACTSPWRSTTIALSSKSAPVGVHAPGDRGQLGRRAVDVDDVATAAQARPDEAADSRPDHGGAEALLDAHLSDGRGDVLTWPHPAHRDARTPDGAGSSDRWASECRREDGHARLRIRCVDGGDPGRGCTTAYTGTPPTTVSGHRWPPLICPSASSHIAWQCMNRSPSRNPTVTEPASSCAGVRASRVSLKVHTTEPSGHSAGTQ